MNAGRHARSQKVSPPPWLRSGFRMTRWERNEVDEMRVMGTSPPFPVYFPCLLFCAFVVEMMFLPRVHGPFSLGESGTKIIISSSARVGSDEASFPPVPPSLFSHARDEQKEGGCMVSNANAEICEKSSLLRHDRKTHD